ncbi:MAG: hypothetical protein WKG07_30310 [Hymenobacter sp.]
MLWLPLAAAQGVPPARTLLLVLLAFFLLLALSTEALLGRLGGSMASGRRGLRLRWPAAAALALVLAGYGSYRLAREQVILAFHARQRASVAPGLRLAARAAAASHLGRTAGLCYFLAALRAECRPAAATRGGGG